MPTRAIQRPRPRKPKARTTTARRALTLAAAVAIWVPTNSATAASGSSCTAAFARGQVSPLMQPQGFGLLGAARQAVRGARGTNPPMLTEAVPALGDASADAALRERIARYRVAPSAASGPSLVASSVDPASDRAACDQPR